MESVELEKDQQREDKIDYFTALDDDSILEIFQRLSLGDLWTIGETCKKFNELVKKSFKQNYPEIVSRQICILKRGKTFRLCRENRAFGCSRSIRYKFGSEKYIEYFGRQLENIKLCFQGSEVSASLIEFIKSSCSENIRKICFDGLRLTSASYEKEFKDILKNVESVTFQHCSVGLGMQLENIVNDLPHLKDLKILGHNFFLEKVDWQHIKCPKLKTFTCTLGERKPTAEDLTNFFEEHPTVKKFSCYMFQPMSDRLKTVINTVIQCKNVERLFIDINGHINFCSIEKELKVLDKRDSFSALGFGLLSHRVRNLHELASVNSLTALRFSIESNAANDLNQHFEALNLMPNMKTLWIDGYIENLSEDLSLKLKNVEELLLEETYKVKDDILRFVRNSPKLRQISIFESLHLTKDTCNIAMLNRERKRLDSAVKLTISITDYGNMSSYAKQQKTNYEFIEVQRNQGIRFFDERI